MHIRCDRDALGSSATAIRFLSPSIGLILRIICIACQILTVPFISLLLFLLLLLWLACLGMVMGCGAIARLCRQSRRVSYAQVSPVMPD